MEGPRSPEGFTPTATITQNVHSVSTSDGDVNLAGRDVLIHKHYHGAYPGQIDIISALRAIRNLRKGTGIPGAGKSVLASIVIGELEARAAAANGNICVAYVYIRYSDAADMTIRNVLEVLVKQTVERHPDCAAIAGQVYARHLSEDTQPSEAELLQLLRQFTGMKMATFYAIDALDEAPDKLQLEIIKKLASLNVRLFITSRPLKTVEARAPEAHRFSIAAKDDDLDLHIAHGIDRSPDLEVLLEKDPSLREEVVSSIKRNCGGMFLHASLQLDALCQSVSMQDIRDTLDNFPSSIEDVYLQTWRRIHGQTPKLVSLAKTVLVWVLNASRSMKIDELECAVATSPTSYKFEPAKVVSGSTLITLCRGLVVFEEENRIIRLVHYTAKGTLQRLLTESFPHPHSLLATICMTHLAERGFQNSAINSEQEFTATLQKDPLLAYALDAWAPHARQSLDIKDMRHRTATFISDSHAFPAFTEPGYPAYFDILTPLHLLAQYNFPFSLLGDDIGDPNIATKIFQSIPLVLAAWYGHSAFARDLLNLPNIRPNLADNAGWTPLTLAVCDVYTEIVTLLLAHPDTQVNLLNSGGTSSLAFAASRGNEGIVEHLLAKPGIDVNVVDKNGNWALLWAVHKGYEGIVKLLLAFPGIEVNITDQDGRSALFWAATLGHQGIAALLLMSPGIQVNSVNSQGVSALIAAAGKGHEGIVRCLLARSDVQANLLNETQSSALMCASEGGFDRVVSLLLAHPKILVNLANEHGFTALMFASFFGHANTVAQILAFNDTDVNLVNEDGHTALKLAVHNTHETIVRLFMAVPHVDIWIKCHVDGHTALTTALALGLDEIARLLHEFEDKQIGGAVGQMAFADVSSERAGVPSPKIGLVGDADESGSEGSEAYEDAEEWLSEGGD